MLPQKHFFYGVFFCIGLYFFYPNIEIIHLVIVLASTVLIDVDHYLYYVYKKKDLSLINAVKWFFAKRDKFLKLSNKEKTKVFSGLYIFHGIESVIVLIFLTFFVHHLFYFVLIGVLFHLFLDYIHGLQEKDRIDKVSAVWWDWWKFKKLKELE